MILGPMLERSATLALLFCSAIATQLSAQHNHEDYDDVNPWVGYRATLADTDDRRGTATLNIARQDSDGIVRHAAAEALKDRDEDD